MPRTPHSGEVYAGETAIGLTGMVLIPKDPHPLPPSPGKMRVVLNVHGGKQGLADVMEGLVRRNIRTLRSGIPGVGAVSRAPARPTGNDGVWRDIVSCVGNPSAVTAGTLAAWKTAEMRVRGDAKAGIGFDDTGRPVSVTGDRSVIGFAGGERVRGLRDTEGRSNEFMVLTVDDDSAYAVRDVNDAIARHNSRRMKSQGLPLLYESGVRYETEGSPELWWDAEEILSHGHDDCEGLAAYRAGELINQGHDATVYTRLIEGPAGAMGGSANTRLFHAITKVREPDGSISYDDPSAVLGMPTPRWYLDYAAKRRAKGLPL